MQENKHHLLLKLWFGMMVWLCCTPLRAASLRVFNTRNYTVHTDVLISDARPFAKHMDKVFDEYKRRFEKLKLTANKISKKMNLYLFETQGGYAKFLSSKGIPAQNTGGMFVVNPKVNGLFTYLKDRPVRQTLSTLQHEGFHQFAFAYIGPTLPIWVNEGIAQYFEDGILVGRRFYLDVPSAIRLNEIKNAVNHKQSLPFSKIITMTDRQWSQNVQNNPRMASLQYGQAWSMVYYLINANDKLLTAFNQYLIAVSNGIDSQIAFTNAFALSDSNFVVLTYDFEKAWKGYTRSLKPNAISQVADNMNFLAQGLIWVGKKKRPMPKSTQELRSILQKVNYRITRTINGVQTTFEANDESLYRYQLPNGSTTMLQLKKNSKRLPPIISARGLKPSPTLVWYYMDKEIMYDVTYK